MPWCLNDEKRALVIQIAKTREERGGERRGEERKGGFHLWNIQLGQPTNWYLNCSKTILRWFGNWESNSFEFEWTEWFILISFLFLTVLDWFLFSLNRLEISKTAGLVLKDLWRIRLGILVRFSENDKYDIDYTEEERWRILMKNETYSNDKRVTWGEWAELGAIIGFYLELTGLVWFHSMDLELTALSNFCCQITNLRRRIVGKFFWESQRIFMNFLRK